MSVAGVTLGRVLYPSGADLVAEMWRGSRCDPDVAETLLHRVFVDLHLDLLLANAYVELALGICFFEHCLQRVVAVLIDDCDHLEVVGDRPKSVLHLMVDLWCCLTGFVYHYWN
jgi:hypothetical protein